MLTCRLFVDVGYAVFFSLFLKFDAKKNQIMLCIEDSFVKSIQDKYGNDITKLNLSNNGISSLGSIGKLKNLTKINLSKNSLYDIKLLAVLTKLSALNLAENQM
jgi:Leucine-rich repeat (LRR) protein